MDRVVVRKRIDKRILIGGGAAARPAADPAVLAVRAARRIRSRSARDRLGDRRRSRTGMFDDFLPLRARVTPLVTVYLDAVEGGRVEQMLVEDGAQVVKGQLLAVLSNADLQLSTLARQTEVEQQLNNMRSQELALHADPQRQHARPQPGRDRPRQGAAAVRAAEAAGREGLRLVEDVQRHQRRPRPTRRKRLAILKRSIAQDEALQSSQLAQLRASAVVAQQQPRHRPRQPRPAQHPRAGHRASSAASTSSSASRSSTASGSARSTAPAATSSQADVDEFYLGRVSVGQTATADVDGKTYRLKVAKIYPQVRNGQFQIDLLFVGPEPASIQRGQTMQAKLTLGDSEPRVLIPNGAFFNDTGGNWVFVVDDERQQRDQARRSSSAAATPISSRCSSGLKPGERVITSSYSGLVDKDRLTFDRRLRKELDPC